MSRNEERRDQYYQLRDDIPLNRLNAYLKVINRFRPSNETRVEDFLGALEDVTKRQLMGDCKLLGIPWDSSISLLNFARATRKTVRKKRLVEKPIEPLFTDLPDSDSFLEDLQGYTASEHANRAEVIEAAYSYAMERPGLFLRAHGLFNKEIIAYRHQVEEAQKITEKMLGNAIVVHEVGLGKTITTILILSELLIRDPDMSSLILVPSNLRRLWRKEIKKCLDIPVLDTRVFDEAKLAKATHVLMSIDTAKMDKWADILCQRHWGLIIVDEGHLLRHDDTSRYKFVYSLRSRYRVLLTATPVHNSGYDIYHQVNIVRPGYLGRKAVFADTYMRGERQIKDPDKLRERLKTVFSSRKRYETDLTFTHRDISEVYIDERSTDEKALYEDVLSLLRGVYRRHLGSTAFVRRPSGKEQGIAQIVLVGIMVLRELASHPLSAMKTLSTALNNRVRQFAEVTGDTTDLGRLHAILRRYNGINWENGNHSKTHHLINELPKLIEEHGRVIIYVEFRETQKAIVRRLIKRRSVGLPQNTSIISYHGSLTQDEKAWQEERFNRTERACFVSTDAGGQGLNLQAGNVVVNFDFPWNPMRVEQRIGRVDRIGQDRDVVVKNFITLGTIEQYVYKTLREKLSVCEDVLGHLVPQIFELGIVNQRYCTNEDVLGIGQIIMSSRDDIDLQQRFLSLGQELDGQISKKESAWRPHRRWIDE